MKPVIELISIGTELLAGIKNDADFISIAQSLASYDFHLSYHSTVGDDHQHLKSVFETAVKRSDVVISTGGLGPTTDDITRNIAADVLDRSLQYNSEIEGWIRDHFAARNIEMPDSNRSMAYLPDGAVPIKNKVGNAPGLIISHGENSWVFLLPGPPAEMNPMLDQMVLPSIRSNFRSQPVIEQIYKITGIPESGVQQKITDEIGALPKDMDIAYLASPGDITVIIKCREENRKNLDILDKKIKGLFGDFIYAYKDTSLEYIVGELLRKENKTFALAESCTGGLTADRLTDVSGSSDYFVLGMVAYCNESKIAQLGVETKTLKDFGAVSREVAEEMARGIQRISGADIGISITGIAGPTGGTQNKPVGLVYFGIADEMKTHTQKKQFKGNRLIIKQCASQHALDMIRRYLLKG